MKTEDLYSLFRQHPAVSTDSRNIQPNSLFFALKGPRFNGNAYAAQALETGASYAIVDEAEYAENDRCILVPKVLDSLQNLAWHHRCQFDIPVVGITGSNGKTTTKELLYSVLSQKFNTLATRGNLNNHIGVPLTLLDITSETGIAVIEMGANHQKEIELLCSIAQPTHGLITNVGKAHLEGFGSIEGVMKGKKELYDSLSMNNGIAFVAAGNARLREMAAGLTRVVWYGSEVSCAGESPSDASHAGFSCEIVGELLEDSPQLVFSWHKHKDKDPQVVYSALSGGYNFENLLAAVCLGDHFGVSPEDIKSGIERYVPANNRSQEVQRGNNRLILDAYNANPGSMDVALRHLASRPEAKKMAILGDMFELGNYSEEEHASVIRLVEELGIGPVLLIGTEFYRHRKQADLLLFFEEPDAAGKWLEAHRPADTVILLKGSRGMQLERLLPLLDA